LYKIIYKEVELMNQEELKHYEELLKLEYKHAHDTLKMAEDHNFKDSLRNSTEELSSYDNHPADIGTETYEMEKNLALEGHQMHQMQEIEHAMQKIKDGTYGICDFCGKEIDKERLEALPQANLCIDCEVKRKRDIEEMQYDRSPNEEVLTPPFGRTFKDDVDYNGYDGEDAWQDVQKYGSSDSPQDLSVNRKIDYRNLFYDSIEDPGFVEEVEKIINDEYRNQIPEGHVEQLPKKEGIDYFGEKRKSRGK